MKKKTVRGVPAAIERARKIQIMADNLTFSTCPRYNEIVSDPMDNNSISGFREANCEKYFKVF